jgi:DNA-directed RNA polymerase subunit omega
MKRVTSEKAAAMIGNKFEMILIASIRARELKRGDQPKLVGTGRPTSTALLEIEEGLVGRDYLKKIK